MRRKRAVIDSRIVLPITPMLDLTFQLLFFFIFNFHPADLEGQMDLSLPTDAEKQAHRREDVKPDAKADKDPQLEFPSDLTVKVRTQLDGVNDGEISAIFVRSIEGKEEPVEGLPGLRKYLQDKRETLTNKEAIKVQGDGRLRMRSIMRVMDTCRKAGFKNVSFVPPEDLGR